jgi:hypothetical protein
VTVADMVANVGGTLGLFLGVSFLSGTTFIKLFFVMQANYICILVSGTDVMIFKIFSPKNLAKNWRF